MTFKPFFRWCDLWVGCYWDGNERALYICPLPMIGVKIKLKSKAPELRCIGAYVNK